MTDTTASPYPELTARVAARTTLVQCPDNPADPRGVLTPRGGFENRLLDRFPTLRSVEGPYVNGLIALTWQDDPLADDDLVARSAQAVRDELYLDGEWDGHQGWYGDHPYLENPATPGTCAFKPRDPHDQLAPCGESRLEH